MIINLPRIAPIKADFRHAALGSQKSFFWYNIGMGQVRNKQKEKIGGWAFFLSYAMIAGLLIINFTLLCGIYSQDNAGAFSNFASAALAGAAAAHFLIRGRLSVFIHEAKHALLSNAHGNKGISMEVKKDSGRYKYKFPKSNREANAFISLAPYFLPVFTLLSLVPAFLMNTDHGVKSAVLGLGFGLDLMLNLRDISRAQTDLTSITGGYLVAVFYVLMFNALSASYLTAWVLGGGFGLSFLFYGLWECVAHLAAYYQHRGISK